uniref:Uncharacterized protein AlNc14C137G7120 n=1 Tax=Albugo laibachii Nc14 TaxID=890382 RepID=F0WKT0_9STRA|nr:conserved hypothetical protein [Albugo laibachii Nc14]|eukprot:CCA21887.1 conserved hypothetical protein [Albugo laibachii Nc14]
MSHRCTLQATMSLLRGYYTASLITMRVRRLYFKHRKSTFWVTFNKNVSVQSFTVIGYPVCIEDDKYHRNALLFNIGFVAEEGAQLSALRPLLRKFGTLLEMMERQSGFLHKETTKALLPKILPQMLHDLIVQDECIISIDKANILNLKIFPQNFSVPQEVSEYHVPVPLCDLRVKCDTCAEWDLAIQQIVPFLDGVKSIRRISMEANMEIQLVKKCVAQLIFFNYVQLIDIFAFSNIYAPISGISSLATQTELQLICAEYVTKSRQPIVPFAKIFALYCSMQPNLRLSDFCLLYAESLESIDIRRFVTFGILYHFIKRVFLYPVILEASQNIATNGTSNGMKTTTSPSLHPQSAQRSYNFSNAIASSLSPNCQPSGPQSVAIMPSNGPSTPHLTPPPFPPLVYSKRQSAAMAAAATMKATYQYEQIQNRMDGNHHTDEICTEFLIRYVDLEAIWTKKKPNSCVIYR